MSEIVVTTSNSEESKPTDNRDRSRNRNNNNKRKLYNGPHDWVIATSTHVDTIIDTSKAQVIHTDYPAVVEGKYYSDTSRRRSTPLAGLPKFPVGGEDSYRITLDVSAWSPKIYGAKLVLVNPEAPAKDDDPTHLTLWQKMKSLEGLETNIKKKKQPFVLDSIIYGLNSPSLSDVLKHVQFGKKRLLTFPRMDIHLPWGPRVVRHVDPTTSMTSAGSDPQVYYESEVNDDKNDDCYSSSSSSYSERPTKIIKSTNTDSTSTSTSTSTSSTTPVDSLIETKTKYIEPVISVEPIEPITSVKSDVKARTIRLSILPAITEIQVLECSKYSGRELRIMMINAGFGNYVKRYIHDIIIDGRRPRKQYTRMDHIKKWWSERSDEFHSMKDDDDKRNRFHRTEFMAHLSGEPSNEVMESIFYDQPTSLELHFKKQYYEVANPDNFLDWFMGVRSCCAQGYQLKWIVMIWNAFLEYVLEVIPTPLTIEQLAAIVVMLLWSVDVEVNVDVDIDVDGEAKKGSWSDRRRRGPATPQLIPDLNTEHKSEESIELKKKMESSKLVKLHDVDTINVVGAHREAFGALLECLDMLLYGHSNSGGDWSIRDRGIMLSLLEIQKIQRSRVDNIINSCSKSYFESGATYDKDVHDLRSKELVDNFLGLYVPDSYLHSILSSMSTEECGKIIATLIGQDRRNVANVENLFV
jgi:hypothetical protein